MSYSILKKFIFSLEDLDFLSIVSGLDFYNKSISIKKHYWNFIVNEILKVVDIPSRTQMRKLVKRIKELMIQRLSFVSSSSFKRYFLRGIHTSFHGFTERFLHVFHGIDSDQETTASPEVEIGSEQEFSELEQDSESEIFEDPVSEHSNSSSEYDYSNLVQEEEIEYEENETELVFVPVEGESIEDRFNRIILEKDLAPDGDIIRDDEILEMPGSDDIPDVSRLSIEPFFVDTLSYFSED